MKESGVGDAFFVKFKDLQSSTGKNFRVFLQDPLALEGKGFLTGNNLEVIFKLEGLSIQVDMVLAGSNELQGQWRDDKGETGALTLASYEEIIKRNGLSQGPGSPGGSFEFSALFLIFCHKKKKTGVYL